MKKKKRFELSKTLASIFAKTASSNNSTTFFYLQTKNQCGYRLQRHPIFSKNEIYLSKNKKIVNKTTEVKLTFTNI